MSISSVELSCTSPSDTCGNTAMYKTPPVKINPSQLAALNHHHQTHFVYMSSPGASLPAQTVAHLLCQRAFPAGLRQLGAAAAGLQPRRLSPPARQPRLAGGVAPAAAAGLPAGADESASATSLHQPAAAESARAMLSNISRVHHGRPFYTL